MKNKKVVKIAGWIYLLTIVAAVLNMIFIESKLVYNGATDFMTHLTNNEGALRYSIGFEMVMFSSVIVLSVLLYMVLKPVNKNLSLLAMCFRLAEAIIGGVAVLLGLGLLIIINLPEANDVTLLRFVYELRSISYMVLYGFMSLGSLIVYYLMFKHKMIPSVLGVYGLITYTLMLTLTFVTIFMPVIPETLEMILITPGALFEVGIGIWFVTKGVSYELLFNEHFPSV